MLPIANQVNDPRSSVRIRIGGEHAERLDRDDRAHLLRRRANLHHVDGVVVAEGAAHVGVALDVGVLPRLRQAAVVPEDGAVVQARLALLLVLHDRVALDLGRNLQTGGTRAWHPSVPAAVVQGHAGRTSIFLRVIFGISHTKLYMPSPASSGISCHGEIVLPSCTRQHKAVCVRRRCRPAGVRGTRDLLAPS